MENELTLNDYLSIIKRRWSNILIIFILAMMIITIIAFILPLVYRSEGTITVEAPSISKEIAGKAAAVTYVDERIDKVKQKVFSRESLVLINQKYHLFPTLTDPKKVSQAVINLIDVDTQTKDTSRNPWQNQKVTVALIVGFEYSDPEVTYKVANELVSMFLDENVKARTKRATETTGYLTVELNRLKVDLEDVENKVADYKQSHVNSLPEHLELHMGSVDRIGAEIKTLDRDYKNTQEELRYLDVELTTTTATLKNGTGDDAVKKVSELDKAKAELDRALVLYKETHPTIRALKRKIENLSLEDGLPKEKKVTKINLAAELAMAKIKTQINAAKVRLDSISSQKRTLTSKMSRLQSQIVKIPQVERGLFTLLRDYENAKAKYEDVKAKQINAKIAENLELSDKAERFVLKRGPEFPEYRKSPIRKKIIGLGMFVALGLGLAFAFLLESLDDRVRGQAALSEIIKMRPIAIIPYITTQSELNKKRRIIKYGWLIGMFLIVLIVLATIFHFFVMPINSLITKSA